MAKKTEEEATTPERAIELAIAQIDREFGKGSVMRLDGNPVPWEAISTGSMALDLALGIKGLPKGRIAEIHGLEGSGKSTMCLQVVANAQREGGKCLFIDAEHAIDPVYAKALGVNLEEMYLSQPASGEEAIDVLEKLVKTGAFSVAVVDSVAAMVPKAELEGDMSTQHMGLQPRLMAKAMRKLVAISAETNTLVLFTNQIREKVGVMYGNPMITPGGHALRFAASVRIELRRIDKHVSSDGEVIGSKIRAKVIKNKMAPPLKQVEFNITYGVGVDKAYDVATVGYELGVLERAGAWYRYNGENVGNGLDKTAHVLEEDPELAERIRQDIYERL